MIKNWTKLPFSKVIHNFIVKKNQYFTDSKLFQSIFSANDHQILTFDGVIDVDGTPSSVWQADSW